MQIAIGIGSAYYNGEDWAEVVDYTVNADRIGIDFVWSAEAWGMDAVVPLAFLAAKTKNIRLTKNFGLRRYHIGACSAFFK